MSALRDAVRTVLKAGLRCPACPAMNRPGADIIELDQTGARAFCNQCAYEGPIETFHTKKE